MTYQEVVGAVEGAARSAGRDPSEVTLVAVSKTRTPDEIMRVYEQGQRDFGENRAQEMARKAEVLPPDVRWHFVGHLQTNKVRMIADQTSLLHSLDRESLIIEWAKREGGPALIEVNLAGEGQKSGCRPEQVPGLVARCVEARLSVVGLMAIPPAGETATKTRSRFVELRRMRDRLAADHPGLTGLSMGMSADFEIAIAEGATFIRVGEAIFGPRR